MFSGEVRVSLDWDVGEFHRSVNGALGLLGCELVVVPLPLLGVAEEHGGR